MGECVRVRGLAAVVLIASAVFARADDLVSVDEWITLTTGNTVHYQADGAPTGAEYYPKGGGYTVYVTPEGECVEGVWAHDEGRFCFLYGDSLQCFVHFRRDGALVARHDVSGEEQIVSKIATDQPLACDPE